MREVNDIFRYRYLQRCLLPADRTRMPVVHRQQGGPSCFEKVKYGVMTGLVLGMCTGALFGGFGGLRYFAYCVSTYLRTNNQII